MQIKRIDPQEREKALELVLSTFMQYEAPEYSDEGIETFINSIHNTDYLNNLILYGAYEEDILYGVIGTRNQGNHIALLFVDSKYHRQGIGKKLVNYVLKHSISDEITVNSSPYAVDIYRHLGFTDLAAEQTMDGIRYTPMHYIK